MESILPIQAVLFDYGMVLSGPADPSAWARMRSLTGHDETTLHHAYWEPRHDYDRGALTGREYWTQVAAAGENHTDLAFDQLIDHLIAADTDLWTQPNQPMIDWALSLQKAGIRTGILSNLGDAMTEGVLSRHPWLNGFYHRTFSYTLGTAKPDLAIYAHAATGLETPPENILFIDDREDNIAAAQAAGMQTLRYTTHTAFEQEMHSRSLDSLLHPEINAHP
ncbi:HAD family hydrolase [Granulicella sibirica]|uniref:Uncharacterized protein n=1 Tax=Granulicella sibirica TaxID=2479048 RepID=A0A4Q0T015_9BACT|nr:HAD family phosphatase [Granulicella sibirica]RXH56032.1 hypothetical protein GRAN_2889 [Granulicella sibirica]